MTFICIIFIKVSIHIITYAKVIYPLFMKRRSLHKKGIDYLSIRIILCLFHMSNVFIFIQNSLSLLNSGEKIQSKIQLQRCKSFYIVLSLSFEAVIFDFSKNSWKKIVKPSTDFSPVTSCVIYSSKKYQRYEISITITCR